MPVSFSRRAIRTGDAQVAWDAREAAELFARELELDLGSHVQADAVRVHLVLRGAGPHREVAA